MDFIRLKSALTVAVLLTGFSAQAAIKDPALVKADAIQSALKFRDSSLVSVSGTDADLKDASQDALNNLVRAGISALRDSGHDRDADRSEQEWDSGYSTYLTSAMGALDLGDHDPLSKWLANFYVKLEDRLGSSILYQGLIGDIYAMNYALPVVFTPKNGKWKTGSAREWVEYRKHFIPFANVLTYYGVNIACNAVMKKQGLGKEGKKLCGKVADKLRFVMGRRIAPKISDFIFNRANALPATLDITDSDRTYLTASDLVAELQKEGAL